MAGKGFEASGSSPLDDIWDAIDKLQRTLTNTRNNRQPTQPTYDFWSGNPGDIPDDAIEGQVALGNDDTAWQYTNGAWKLIGGGRWYDAVLEPPWVQGGDDFHPVQYARGAPTHLRFRGAAIGGTGGDTMFFLPANFWPVKFEYYVIARADVPVVLEVSPSDGSVTPLS